MRITKPYQPLAVLNDAYKVPSVPESLHLVKKKSWENPCKFQGLSLTKKFPLRRGEVWWPSYNFGGTSGSDPNPWNEQIQKITSEGLGWLVEIPAWKMR